VCVCVCVCLKEREKEREGDVRGGEETNIWVCTTVYSIQSMDHMLQCVAVCCSVLQYVALCCSIQ